MVTWTGAYKETQKGGRRILNELFWWNPLQNAPKGAEGEGPSPPPPLYANVPEESAITVQEPTSWVFLFVYTNNQTEQR